MSTSMSNKKRCRRVVSDEEEEEIIVVRSSPCKRWKPKEEIALIRGIKKYGLGRWKTILKDKEFSRVLRHRTSVSLKDKWRNLKRRSNKKTDPRHKGKAIISDDGVENLKKAAGIIKVVVKLAGGS